MNRYVVDLFDVRNQWFYEAIVEAVDIKEAAIVAHRDYADKYNKIKNITRA